MQQRARPFKDVAAQSAHFASFWVSRVRVMVKAGAASAWAYAAPRLIEANDAVGRFAVRARQEMQPHVTRLATATQNALALVRTQFSRALAEAETATRAFRFAAAPYAIAATLVIGSAEVLAPGVLLIGAAVAVMNYRPPAPVTAPRPGPVPPPADVNLMERFQTINDQRWEVSDGWDNGYWNWSDWRRSALHTSANGLSIIMAPNPAGASKPYAGGELQSQAHYRYGYYEVRMRVPSGDGIVAAFYSYTMPSGRDSQQEIDIEFVGARTRMIEFAYHLGRHTQGQRVRLPFDATEGFHTYAFEWTPSGLRFLVDNRLLQVMDDAGARSLSEPERLYLSLSASRIAEWTGDLDRSRAPWRMDVSCVVQADSYQGRSLCDPSSLAGTQTALR